MRQSEPLFELIKSLNKSEKGYFKKFVSLYGDQADSNYLQLFDAINDQDKYDEPQIKTALKKSKAGKWLASEKIYLHKLILKALRNYHAGESIDNQIAEMLNNIEILHKKALYAQCVKVIDKAKKIALRNEKFSKLLDLLRWEKSIYSYNQRSELKAADSFEEETEIVNKLQNEHRYEKLSFQMSSFTIKERHVRNLDLLSEMEKAIKDPLLQNEKLAISNSAKILYHNTWARYHEINGDLVKSKASLKKILNEIDSDPELAIRQTFLCISTYNNYLNICLMQEDYEEHKKALERLQKQIPSITQQTPESLAIRLFESQSNQELAVNISIGNFKEALSLVPQMEKQLKHYEGKMVRQAELVIYYNLAYICIGAGEFKQAKTWVNKITTDHAAGSALILQDAYSFALIFNLIIQYELKNYDGLAYYWRSTYRHLLKRKRLYKTENIFLQFFRKNLTIEKSEVQVKLAFKELLKELKEVMKDPFEKQVLNYFDINSWLESKVQDKTFAGIVQSKYMEKRK